MNRNREVFQTNKVILFGIIVVIYVGVTIAYYQAQLQIWILPIVYVAGILIIFSSLKTKLIIEDGSLRYEKLVGGEEISLKSVSQIVIREVETIVNKNDDQHISPSQSGNVEFGSIRINKQPTVNQERKVQRNIYILDEAGRTIFSLPANVVGFSQRTRFKEAIHHVNPNIEVF